MEEDARCEFSLPILNNPPSTAIKIDEQQELVKKAQYLLPSFRKMGYQERREYAQWNPELYSKLENQKPGTPAPNDKQHFIKLTDAKTGETKYVYMKRKK